jgi:RimJ/RimL family protein N-acetyltransferase
MTATLVGMKSRIRPSTRDDHLAHVLGWYADREATRYVVRAVLPQSLDDVAEMFDAMRRSATDLEWAVEDLDGRVVGLAGLHQLNWIARSAEFRIFLGDRTSWGSGVGTEVTQMLVAYAFDALALHKVWLGVNAANAAALTTYDRAGFTREGVLRDDVFRNGRYYDVVRMSILRDEYDAALETWAIRDELCRQLRDSG